MTSPLSFKEAGCSDGNRDTTAALEAELRSRLGSEEVVCTYSGFDRRVSVYLGDELDPRKRELMLGVPYALGVPIDIECIADSVVEAAMAALHRRKQ